MMNNFEKHHLDFDKGLENGLDQLEKENYENILSSEVNLSWLLDKRTITEQKLLLNEQNIQESKIQRLAILEKKQKHQKDFYIYESQIDKLGNDNKNLWTRFENYKEEQKKQNSSYPFLAGILYLAAGLTFILGDLIISHEIVAYALNIRNNVEAWIFAVGLASVSILLKPAYERLVEEPYLNKYSAKTQRIYTIFQIVLVAIAIGTLAILGWFRYEAYKTDRLKESINRELKALQLSNNQIFSDQNAMTIDPVTNEKINQKLQAFDALNIKLINSPWAIMSFVLSGVLFAVAGAICLGIALPIVQTYTRRWFQLGSRAWFIKRKITKNQRKIERLNKPFFELKSYLEVEQERLDILGNLPSLETKQNKLEAELSDLEEKIRLSHENARMSSYSEGYELGKISREKMSENDYEKLRVDALVNNGSSLNKNAKNRPHLALRKEISDQLFGKVNL